MVAFGQIRKQRPVAFGSRSKTTNYFGGKNRQRNEALYSAAIPSIEPENHPLLPHADTFLNASYGDPEAMRKMTSIGYNQDKVLSNIETNVWIKEGKPLILHRGSSNARDFLVGDVLLGADLSGLDPRLWSAKKITKQAENKYNNVADHCGHSYGGWLAERCSAPLSYVLTYNKGASPFHIRKVISPRQLDIRTKGDLVSLLSKYQNRNLITIDNKGKGFLAAHTIGNLND